MRTRQPDTDISENKGVMCRVVGLEWPGRAPLPPLGPTPAVWEWDWGPRVGVLTGGSARVGPQHRWHEYGPLDDRRGGCRAAEPTHYGVGRLSDEELRRVVVGAAGSRA